MVKSEFGPDALILSSRKERRKGILGRFSKPFYEVTAAFDSTPRVRHEPLPEPPAQESNTLEAFQKSMLAPMAREIKELRAKLETLSVKEKISEPSGAGERPDFVRIKRETATDLQRVTSDRQISPASIPKNEMAELKNLLLQSMDKNIFYGKPAKSAIEECMDEKSKADLIAQLSAELRDNGVDEAGIARLMEEISEFAVTCTDSAKLRKRLIKSIETGINCSGMVKLKHNASRIIALVGPTGVGKTTTIAKLAALAFKQGVSVALITVDTFRVGAVSQLQTYSGIMGIPMAIATSPAELAYAIETYKDKQLLFIDTAGGSPQDKQKVNELNSFLAVNDAIETHLCLSATTRDSELMRTIDCFGKLPLRRMLFTKLDESLSYGCILNTHYRNKLPLSYLTTGQKVPEDIETASSLKIATLILREKKQ